VTVATGDTLATIAKNVYGDSALWYLIADANGLSGNSDLRVGQALSIPSRVGSGSNANTFTPYNSSKVIGDTSPNLPQPAPRAQGGGGGCGGLGSILMIVVLVVVTVYTAGAMSGFVGSFSSTMSAGMGVLTGGAVGGAAGVAGAFGAAGSALGTVGTLAVASAAGSVASQLFGIAIGAQKDFSWNQVALAALGGAVSGGLMGSTPLGPMGGAAGDAAQVIARAAISSALNQGIAVVTGLQKDFNWSNVAFAAVGAGMSHAMNGALGLNAPTVGPSGFDRFALSTMSGFASGMTMNALRGGQMTAAQVATDAFGNALARSISEGMRSTQGVGAYSALDYRNGADIESDNYAPPAISTPVAGPGNIVSTDLPALALEPEVDNYDLQGKSRAVGVAGREGALGAWGIAESIAGKGANNGDINRIKNQLLTLNPELADGVKLGQRYYMPDQDTAENKALARSADGAYARQLSDAAARSNNANDDARDIRAGYASRANELANSASVLKNAAEGFASQAMQAYNNGNKAQGDTYLKYASGYYAESNNATASANQFKAAIPAYVLPPAAVGSPGSDLAFELKLGGALYAVVGGNFELTTQVNISKLTWSITEFEWGLGVGFGGKGVGGWKPIADTSVTAPMKLLSKVGDGQADGTGAISLKAALEVSVPTANFVVGEFRAGVQSPLNGVPVTDKNFGGFYETKIGEYKVAPTLQLGATVKVDIFNNSYKRVKP
jgi:hypothetical protein